MNNSEDNKINNSSNGQEGNTNFGTVTQDSQPKFDSMTGEPLNNTSSNSVGNDQVNLSKNKNSNIKKVLIIIGVVVVIIILLVVIAVSKFLGSTKKYVCESSMGNITLAYNDQTVVGYLVTGGITYDLDEQQKVANQIGIDAYLEEFNNWFVSNTGGTCK